MKYLLIICATFAIFFSTAFGNNAFFNTYIKNKPKGVVRDFYIWQYLQMPNIDGDDIQKAYDLLSAKNPYIKKTLKQLGVHESLSKNVLCANMHLKIAMQEDSDCLATNLNANLSKIRNLNSYEVVMAIDKLKHKYKILTDSIKVLYDSNFKERLFESNVNVFNTIYNALDYDEKNEIFTDIDTSKLAKLAKHGNTGFFNIIERVIIDSKMQGFKEALLDLDIKNAAHNTTFLLGINELRFGSKTKAMQYFDLAYRKSNDVFFKDRALFWQYQTSKDKKYLQQLAKSSFVDIFSLYAVQKLHVAPSFKIITHISSLNSKKPPFDVSDPYIWQNILNTMLNTRDSLKLANAIAYFSYKDTLPHLAYLMQKIDKYSTNYYITPYNHLVTFQNTSEKSFVYSIAKQESYFIPTAISKSFALGLMQIMPANVSHFAKFMGLHDIKYNDLFKPKIALEMGTYYIRELKREFNHPLFIAYAYNGGPGFLRRLLSKNELFLKNREYEPWLSMELLPYTESRFYGMKVLANYIMYENIFGHKINIEKLLHETLIYHRH